MSFSVDVDLSRLVKKRAAFLRQFEAELARVATLLAQDAEEHARRLVTILIYNTPQRSGYDRTGALRESIKAFPQKLGSEEWIVRVGATSGPGAEYALFNEAGTLEGSVTFEEILAQARGAAGDLIILEFGRPSRGLEPRPFIIPTAVHTVRVAPAFILQAVRRSAAQVGVAVG